MALRIQLLCLGAFTLPTYCKLSIGSGGEEDNLRRVKRSEL